jgi:hypothetical protein
LLWLDRPLGWEIFDMAIGDKTVKLMLAFIFYGYKVYVRLATSSL